jgi:two-component system LytT family sensor kinase
MRPIIIPSVAAVKQHFKNYRWLLHLVFWLLVIGTYVVQLRNLGLFKPDHGYVMSIVALLTKVLPGCILAYGFQFIVLPLFPRTTVFWATLFIWLLITYSIQVILIKLMIQNEPVIFKAFDPSFFKVASRNAGSYLFQFVLFIALYYFIDIYDQQQGIRRLAEFKTQKIKLESSFLKSQVNPHFLFNTLNNIYALSLKKSDQTAVIIDRLESLLNYMLYECQAELVPLENEFKFTSSYIDLEKLRHKEDRCTVSVEIKGEVSDKNIAPLLLINFIENAFKHGTKTSFGKSWINMDIEVTNKALNFRLQNSKPQHTQGQAISEYKGGIGLKNVKRRLEILYPQRHSLTVNNEKEKFEVDLIINF